MTATCSRLALCSLVFLAIVACNRGGSPTAPATESEPALTVPLRLPGTVALGSPQLLADASLIPAAMWDVTIDVESLTASVGKRPDERSGQAYADAFLLEVTRFFTASVMEIEGVTRTAPGRIKVDYTIAHPFAAATNPDGAATAKNRADLGITGIVMFPLDVTAETPISYFAESERPIIANTDAIATPDGYYVPAGLIYEMGMQANCFPFRRLVNDSRLESRIGQPLEHPGVGNFDPWLGWQRSNWGPDRTGWTGYGALHQGQVARNSVELNLPAAPITSISLPVMLIAKYLDPVGTPASTLRAANRLPTADFDRNKFLYRMPQGAWDLERLDVRVEGEFAGIVDSELTLRMRITDWDARTDEWAAPFFNEQAPADWVREGESGMPQLGLDIPTLLDVVPTSELLYDSTPHIRNDDTAVGGDAGEDTGRADDPLYLPLTLTRSGERGLPSGQHVGLVRLLDAAEPGQAITPLSPVLAPLTQNVPVAEIYQAFRVAVVGPPIGATCSIWPSENIQSATQVAVHAGISSHFSWADPWMDIDWNGDGDWNDAQEDQQHLLSTTASNYFFTQPVNNPTITPAPRQVHVRFHLLTQSETITLDYVLGPNQPPVPESKYAYQLNAQRLPSPGHFQLMGLQATDPENDLLGYGVATPGVTGITESNTVPMDMPANLTPYSTYFLTRYSIYVTDPAHRGTAGTFVRSQVVRIDPLPPAGWVYPLPKDALPARAHALTYDAQGNLYLATALAIDGLIGTQQFFAGEVVALSLDPAGALRWVRRIADATPPSPILQLKSAVVLPSGELLLATHRIRSFNFGGGVRPGSGLSLLRLASASGAYASDQSFANNSNPYVPELTLRPDNSILLQGSLTQTGTVGFGGTQHQLLGAATAYALQLSPAGAFQWDYAPLGGYSRIVSADLDQQGNCYLGGMQSGTVDYGSGDTTAERSSALILSLSPQGTFQWMKLFEDDMSDSSVDALAGAGLGSGCVAVGQCAGDLYLDGERLSDCRKGFWVQYDSEGVWQAQLLGTGYTRAITGLPDGGWLIGGTLYNGFNLGSGPIPVRSGDADRYLIRYTQGFAPVWQSLWQSGSSDSLDRIAVSPTGPVAISALCGPVTDHDPGPAEFFAVGGNEAIITVSGETGQW